MTQKLSIIYATETGNAEDVAFRIYREICNVFEITPTISDIQDYDILNLPQENHIIFITSTTGDGDNPDSMKKFWTYLLRKSLPSNCLSNTKHAVFGLGDSSYEKFNSSARKLKKRLEQLGSTQLLPIGLGDDQAKYSYLEELDPWILQLIHCLKLSDMPLSQQKITNQSNISSSNTSTSLSPTNTSSSSYKIKVVSSSTRSNINSDYNNVSNTNTNTTHSFYQKPLYTKTSSSSPINMIVTQNTRLTSESWYQDIRHLILTFPPNIYHSQDSMYTAGDVAVIYPHNDPQLVTRLLKLIYKYEKQLYSSLSSQFDMKSTVVSSSIFSQLNNHIDINENSIGSILIEINYNHLNNTNNNNNNNNSGNNIRRSRLPPMTCTLLQLLTQYLDISGRPKRSFFEQLSHHTSNATTTTTSTTSKSENEDKDEEVRLKLLEMASTQGTDLFYDYCIKERRNYVEILEDFPSLLIPLSALINYIPILKPRHYSIASYPHLTNNELHLCVSVENTRTPYGRKIKGVCSHYLANTQIHDKVKVYIRSGPYMYDDSYYTTVYKSLQQVHNVTSARNGTSSLSEANTIISSVQIKNQITPRSSSLFSYTSIQSTLNTMKIPVMPSLICIGPGTGIAPIRSITQQYLSYIVTYYLHIYYQLYYEYKLNKDDDSSQNMYMNTIVKNCITDDCSSHTSSQYELFQTRMLECISKRTKVLIFYGCRKQSHDYLYANEWNNLMRKLHLFLYELVTMNFNKNIDEVMHQFVDIWMNKNDDTSENMNIISNDDNINDGEYDKVSDNISNVIQRELPIQFIPAFSQDQEHKVYVTHKLQENRDRVYSILTQGGRVFISGAAKRMPADVKKTFIDILIQCNVESKMTIESATQFITNMEKTKKYIVDAWSS